MDTNKRNIAILFFTLVVVMLGFGIIIPIMPFYIKQFNAGGSALGMMMAIYGVMQFLFAPIWGSLSDRIGRKPILMLGVLGNAISLILMGIAGSLTQLFIYRALAGVLSSATLPTAMAYVSDSSSVQERSGRMGLVGAAMGIGMVIGPGLGGWLASNSLSTPFFLAGGLSFLALLIILFFLPESPHTPIGKKQKIKGLQLNLLRDSLTGALGLLFVMSFLLSFGLTNFEGIFGLYAAVKYEYNAQQVGTVLTLIGLISAIAQGAITGPMTRRFGEVNVIRAAMLSTAIGFVLMILPRSTTGIFLTAGFFVLSNALINPSVSSLISKYSHSGQGTTMGVNNSFLSLGRIIGPLWAGNMFDLDINLPYLSGAFIMLIGAIVAFLWLGRYQQQEENAQA